MTLLLVPVVLYFFWIFFIVYADCVNAWSKVKIPLRVLLLLLVVPFALVDVMVNLTLATVIFLRLPPCWLAWSDFKTPLHWSLTWRLTVYKMAAPRDWRGTIAAWICSNMLDIFEHGGHCVP